MKASALPFVPSGMATVPPLTTAAAPHKANDGQMFAPIAAPVAQMNMPNFPEPSGPSVFGGGAFGCAATSTGSSNLLGDLDVRHDVEDAPYWYLKMLVTNTVAGSIIGRSGRTIMELQRETGAKIVLSPHGCYFPGTNERVAAISGQREMVQQAMYWVVDRVCRGADMLKLARVSCKFVVPRMVVGFLIGPNGAHVKSIREDTGATVTISPLFVSPEESCSERVVCVAANDPERLMRAVKMIAHQINQHPDAGACRVITYRPRPLDQPLSGAGGGAGGGGGVAVDHTESSASVTRTQASASTSAGTTTPNLHIHHNMTTTHTNHQPHHQQPPCVSVAPSPSLSHHANESAPSTPTHKGGDWSGFTTHTRANRTRPLQAYLGELCEAEVRAASKGVGGSSSGSSGAVGVGGTANGQPVPPSIDKMGEESSSSDDGECGGWEGDADDGREGRVWGLSVANVKSAVVVVLMAIVFSTVLSHLPQLIWAALS
ncbi:unnamed protein product [Vitrella brassicaformis CCMP3155]|uniref:K Homology domain-containing protein n=3 Tax=Vitrella brassicaformis TaxID=1169539 RepID=A0A0G4GL32_VITBC|nr:unnamed protein product [Vitrella brassicaformis CCMP3155]|eukprot:CEM30736.1 unnamed protein product [Vitrella brassicaformis CCMP3155]